MSLGKESEFYLQACSEGREENVRFMETMLPYFGLEQTPEVLSRLMSFPYFGEEKTKGSDVLVRSLLQSGGVSEYTDGTFQIILNESISFNERRYITWHESSHILHCILNPDFWELSRKRFRRRRPFAPVLSEMVADLGALTFLDLTEGLDEKSMKKYNLNFGMNSCLESREMEFLFKIAVENKSYLKKFALRKRRLNNSQIEQIIM